MYTCEPLRRYSAAISPSLFHSTTPCHSVFSFISPDCLSRQLSDVAMRILVTVVPPGVVRDSGSCPRLPMRMTLLMPRAMTDPCDENPVLQAYVGRRRDARSQTAASIQIGASGLFRRL